MLNIATKNTQFRMVGIIFEDNDQIKGKRVGSTKLFIKQFFRNPFGIIGSIILGLLIIMAIFIPLISKDPNQVYLNPDGTVAKHLPSEAGHIFGTDAYGQDIWSRLWYGIRFSLMLGFIVLVITFIVGTTLGILMGYFPVFDRIMRYIIQLFYNVPDILIYMVLVYIMNPVSSRTIPTTPVVLIQYSLMFSMFTWMSLSLQVRGQILRVKSLDFITASRILGTPQRKIVANFLPMALPIALTQIVVVVPMAILNESILGVIGATATQNIPTLGIQLSLSLPYTAAFPKEVLIPITGLLLVTVSIYFIANAVQTSLTKR